MEAFIISKTYQDEYKTKLITAEQAADLIQAGDHIMYGAFLGRPIDFDQALKKRWGELYNVQITDASGKLRGDENFYADHPGPEHLITNSWFFDVTDRKSAKQDITFYNPCQFSQLCDMIGSDLFSHDIHVQQVSPMDEHGCFSFGLVNVYHLESCLNAKKLVILEVNENMPRVPGGTEDSIHISMVDYVIESGNAALKTLPAPPPATAEESAMAQMIAEQIPNRACIQLGIGALPNAVGLQMRDAGLKDLGIHTEVFVDAMMTLCEEGMISGRYKTSDRCKIAFSFALGTQKIYDFMADNPLMASHSGRYTNNPRIIGSNDNMIAINSCVMMDLFSQAASESAGYHQVSGTGGQLDFVNGAWISNGGKSFLCLKSLGQDRNGKPRSNIVPFLPEGGIVTTPRTAIDYVVTEYGMAQLKGKPTWHRAEEMIRLAHPQFRDALIQEAQRMNIWRRSHKR